MITLAATPSADTHRDSVLLSLNPRHYLIFISVYFLAQTIVRLLLAPSLTWDEAEQVVMSDTFAVIVGEQNTDIPDTVSLPELGEHSWVLPDAVGGFRRQVDALFINAEAPTPANVIRCDSLLTTKSIVRNTRYITILPREVAMPELTTGALRAINIKEAGFQRHVGLVWLKERQFTGLAQAFFELAQQNNAK